MAKNIGKLEFSVGVKTDQQSFNKLQDSLKKLQAKITPQFDKQSFNNLIKTFQDLQNKLNTKGIGAGMDENIQKATSAAKELQGILSGSWNEKLNQLNLDKFNDSVKKSFKSVSDLRETLVNSGEQGAQAFLQLSTQVLNVNTQLKQSSKFLDNMADTFGKTIRYGIASSVFNNFTNSIEKAFYFTKDLDLSLTNIRIVTGDSADQMERFAKSANGAAKELGRSTLDYTDAALTFYQQGLSDAEVETRTKATLMAQNITGIGAQMADYLTAVWNGFQATSENAIEYADKLAAVADTSASDMSQLAIAMSKVASTANAMGVDIDQLNAQIATIVATTRQAPESVGTALKTIYARINDITTGSDEAQVSLGKYSGAMAELGFNVFDASGKLRDTGDVMEQIGERWSTLSREQQIYLSRTMAGTRQYNNLIALFDNWTQYSNMLNVSLEAQGTLHEKNSRYMDSVKAHMEQLNAETERTYNLLSDTGAINSVVDVFNKVLTSLNNFIEGIGGGTNAIMYFGSVLAGIFNKQIVNAIDSAKVQFVQFFNEVTHKAEKIKQEWIDQMTLALNSMNGGITNTQSAGYKAQLEVAKQFQEVAKGLTQEEAKRAIELQKQIGLQAEQVAKLQEQVNKVNARSEAEQKIINQYKDKEWLLQDDIDEEKRRYGWLEKSANIFTTLKNTQEEINEIEKKQVKTQQDINTIENKRVQMSNIWKANTERIKLALDAAGYEEHEINNIMTQINSESLKTGNVFNDWKDKFSQVAEKAQLSKQQMQIMQSALEKMLSKAPELLKVAQEVTNALKGQADSLVDTGRSRQQTQKLVKAISAISQEFSVATGAAKVFGDQSSTGIEKANAAMSVFQGSITALGTYIGGPLGMAVATMVNSILSFLKEATPLGDWLENRFSSVEEKLQKVAEAQSKVNKATKEYMNSRKDITQIKDEFEQLHKRAGRLSEDQQQRYNELIDIISQYNDKIIVGYDDQYNAIVVKNGAIEDTLELLHKEYEQQQKILYSNNAIRGDIEYSNAKKNQQNAPKQQQNVQIWGGQSLSSIEGTLRDDLEQIAARLSFQGTIQNYRDIISNAGLEDDKITLLSDSLEYLSQLISTSSTQDLSTIIADLRWMYNTFEYTFDQYASSDFGELKTLIENNVSSIISAYDDAIGTAAQQVEIATQIAASDFPVPGEIILNNIKFGTKNKKGTLFQGNKEYKQFQQLFGDQWIDIGQKLIDTATINFASGLNYGEDGIEGDEQVYLIVEKFLQQLMSIIDVPTFIDLYNEKEKLLQNAADYTGDQLHQKLLNIGQSLIDSSQAAAAELMTEDGQNILSILLSALLGGDNFTFDDNSIISFITDRQQQIKDSMQNLRQSLYEANPGYVQMHGGYSMLNELEAYANTLSGNEWDDFLNKIKHVDLSDVQDNFSEFLKLLEDVNTQAEEISTNVGFGEQYQIIGKLSKEKDIDSIKNGREVLNFWVSQDPALIKVAAQQDAGYYSEEFGAAVKKDLLKWQEEKVSEAKKEVASKQSKVNSLERRKANQEQKLENAKTPEQQISIKKRLKRTNDLLATSTKELSEAKSNLIVEQSNLSKVTEDVNGSIEDQLELSKQIYNTQLSAYQKFKEKGAAAVLTNDQATAMAQMQVQHPELQGLERGTEAYMEMWDVFFVQQKEAYQTLKQQQLQEIKRQQNILKLKLFNAQGEDRLEILQQIEDLQIDAVKLENDHLDTLEEETQQLKTQLQILQEQRSAQQSSYNNQLSAYQKFKEGKTTKDLTDSQANDLALLQVRHPELQSLERGTQAYMDMMEVVLAQQREQFELAKQRELIQLRKQERAKRIELRYTTDENERIQLQQDIQQLEADQIKLGYQQLDILEDETDQQKAQLEIIKEKYNLQKSQYESQLSAYQKFKDGKTYNDLTQNEQTEMSRLYVKNPALQSLKQGSEEFMAVFDEILKKEQIRFDTLKVQTIALMQQDKARLEAELQGAENKKEIQAQIEELIIAINVLQHESLDLLKEQDGQFASIAAQVEMLRDIIQTADSGKMLSTQQFVDLSRILDTVIQRFPELGYAVDFLTSELGAGTEQYKATLHEVQEALDKISLEDSLTKVTQSFNNISFDPIDIQINADAVEKWCDQFQDFFDRDYEVSVSVNNTLNNEFDDIMTHMDSIYDAAAKIGENFIVAAQDIGQVVQVFPQLQSHMQLLDDGSWQLSQNMVQYAMGAAQGEIQASSQSVIERLQQEADYHNAKADQYEQIARLAQQLASNQVLTEDEKREKIQGIDTAIATVKQMNDKYIAQTHGVTSKEMIDNQEQVAKTGSNMFELLSKNMLGSICEAAKGCIQNLKAVQVTFRQLNNDQDISPKDLIGEQGAYKVDTGKISGALSKIHTTSDATVETFNTDDALHYTQEQWRETSNDATARMLEERAIAEKAMTKIYEIQGRLAQTLNGLGNVARGEGINGKKPEKQQKQKQPKEEKEKQQTIKQPPKPNEKDLIEEEIDLYHDVNIQLQKIARNLEKVQKQQKKLTGKDLIKSFQKQLDILNQQLTTQRMKASIAEGQALDLRGKLQGMGAIFADDGQVANYNELIQIYQRYANEAIVYYNSLSKEQQQYAEGSVKLMQDQLEQVKKYLSQYDRVLNQTIPDIQDSINETLQKKIEVKIQNFKIGVEANINLSELTREYNAFVKDIQKQVRDDDILQQTSFAMKDIESYSRKGQYNSIQAQTDHLNDLMAQIKSINKTGTSSIYGDNKALALEDLKNSRQALESDLRNILELSNEIKANVLASIDQLNDGYAKQEKYYSHIADMLSHDEKMVELIYGEHAYDRMDYLYRTQFAYDQQHLAALAEEQYRQQQRLQQEREHQKTLQFGSNAWKQSQERIDKYQQAWMDATTKMNQAFESSIQNIIDKYENGVKKIFHDFEADLTGGMDLDFISEEWELLKRQDEQVLDAVNRSYGLDTLQNRYDTLLSENRSSIKAQKELNMLKEKQLDSLKSMDKLTQYDLDRANKQLDIEMKRLALEEHRDNKTKLRLRRDSQGNYSFQYTVDADDILQKQQALRDAANDLYNFTKESYAKANDQYYRDLEDYLTKASEAAIKYRTDTDAYNKYMEMLNHEYSEVLQNDAEQVRNTRVDLSKETFNAITTDLESLDTSYSNVIGSDGSISTYYDEDERNVKEWIDKNKKYIEDELGKLSGQGGIYEQNATNFRNMINNGDNGMVKTWNNGIDQIVEKLHGKGGKGGEGTFTGALDALMSKVQGQRTEYQTQMSQLELKGKGSFGAIGTAVDDVINKIGSKDQKTGLLGANEQLIESYENIWKQMNQKWLPKLQEYLKTMQGISDASKTITDSYKMQIKEQKSTVNSANKSNLRDDPAIPDIIDTNPYHSEGGNFIPGGMADASKFLWPQGTYITSDSVYIPDNPDYWQGYRYGAYPDIPNTLQAVYIGGQLIKPRAFDTGGYTGDWSSSSGRLAFLHSKELVLNTEDTQNILNAVNLVRGMNDVLSKINGYNLSNLVNGINSNSAIFDQNVHITAEFPSVTNHSEIELALANLTNRASQYIHSNRR